MRLTVRLRRAVSLRSVLTSVVTMSRSPLRSDYTVQLFVDQAPVPVYVGGQPATTLTTRWNDSSSTRLASLLRDYRLDPDSFRAAALGRTLHEFLFANGTLDAPVAQRLPDLEAFVVRGGLKERSLLLNLPWEYTQGPASIRPSDGGALLGALASWPVARVLDGMPATTVSIDRERLRLLCAISAPPDAGPLEAERFLKAINQVCRERAGLLDARIKTGVHFDPRVVDVETELAAFCPHVLVIVCHGRIERGVAQLRFEEWISVSRIASRLAATNKAVLAILVACDQVFHEEGPTASSGALAMLEAGVPAVVAMQGRIRADLAAMFLGGSLDSTFKMALPRAIAEGRRQMAPGSSAQRFIDWSFPALFIAENAWDLVDDLPQRFALQSALEALLRAIPHPGRYIERNEIDERLHRWLQPTTRGLRVLVGAPGMGKSTTARWACRDAVQHAITTSVGTFRPILYVDLQREGGDILTGQHLLALLRECMHEAETTMGATVLAFPWPVARSADGAGVPSDVVRQIVEVLDSNRMVLVLDHVPTPVAGFWADLLQRSRAMATSALIVTLERLDGGLSPEEFMQVGPLTLEETRRWVEALGANVAQAEWYFERTGGSPLLLIALTSQRVPEQRAGTAAAISLEAIMSRLAEADRVFLGELSLLPNGVTPALAEKFIPSWHEADVLELVDAGMIITDYRYGARWLRVAGLIADWLDRSRANTAAESVAERFTNVLTEDGVDPEQELLALAATPGGVQFLHDVQRLFVRLQAYDRAKAFPTLLHTLLFQRGRWSDALLLWKRVLDVAPREMTVPSDWILLAKAAHVLGLSDAATSALAKAEEGELGIVDRIDILLQRAAILKDTAGPGNVDLVDRLYTEAFSLLDDAARSTDGEVREIELREKRAGAIYNRALHLRYWKDDVAGALRDLEIAAAEFAELGQWQMRGLSLCEWAEVQISLPIATLAWGTIHERLIEADEIFTHQDSSGDRAFCNYQLARYYRWRPPSSPEEQQRFRRSAQSAYRICSEQARIAGDARQEHIARIRLAEIEWRELLELTPEQAFERLESSIRILRTFDRDAWSCRTLRDGLHLMASANTTRSLPLLEEAWRACVSPPLHPEHGSDARRSAAVLHDYLQALDSVGDSLSADRVAVLNRALVESWLDHTIDPSAWRTWIDAVRNFADGGDTDG